MSRLPARFEPDRGRALARAEQASEQAIYKAHLNARVRAETEAIDAAAARDALQAQLEHEIGLLDWGMARVGTSAAKAELVARKVDALAELNARNFQRRWS